ncbi:hypothetical protein BsWGS_13663 [Bradybaena similaris]
MEIKEKSPWETADNHGGNVVLRDEEIKQEQIYEEHPERSWWRETSDSDETTISQDIDSNVSTKDRLCGKRRQIKAIGGCLDYASSIYIDNAEMLVPTPNCVTQTHMLIIKIMVHISQHAEHEKPDVLVGTSTHTSNQVSNLWHWRNGFFFSQEKPFILVFA